jgi:hypothetical protein
MAVPNRFIQYYDDTVQEICRESLLKFILDPWSETLAEGRKSVTFTSDVFANLLRVPDPIPSVTHGHDPALPKALDNRGLAWFLSIEISTEWGQTRKSRADVAVESQDNTDRRVRWPTFGEENLAPMIRRLRAGNASPPAQYFSRQRLWYAACHRSRA